MGKLFLFSPILSDFLYTYAASSRKFESRSEILTGPEVAALLKINENMAYKLVAKREILGFTVGGSWRFDKGESKKWIHLKMS